MSFFVGKTRKENVLSLLNAPKLTLLKSLEWGREGTFAVTILDRVHHVLVFHTGCQAEINQ